MTSFFYLKIVKPVFSRHLTVKLSLYCLCLYGSLFSIMSYASIDVSHTYTAPLGNESRYLLEDESPLTVEEARLALHSKGIAPHQGVLNFGINSKPVWLYFTIENPSAELMTRFIRVEASWLDQVDIYFFSNDRLINAQSGGDKYPFDQRQVDDRFIIFPHDFDVGQTEVLMRLSSPDPLNIPIYLLSLDEMHQKTLNDGYFYGAIYGFLLALLACNILLSFSLKSRRYLYYSQYLFFFILMNLSYTGHGYQWLWPEQVTWQLWLNPILMLAYATTGLMFATRFLDTQKKLKRLHYIIGFTCWSLILLGALFILLGDNVRLLYLAFFAIIPFASLMITSGVVGMFNGIKEARYFAAATIFVTVGAVYTTLTVSGVIEYSNLGFHALEIAMLIEAVLFALALSYQFKIIQDGKITAERLADIDPLTGLYNRRGLYKILTPLLNVSLRKKRALSLLLLDIDYFKQINDLYGHTQGDKALCQLSKLLLNEARNGDLIGRWGGEEFILLLSETTEAEAQVLAQRIVDKVSELSLAVANKEVNITVSIGVSCLETPTQTFDDLLDQADKALYQAKSKGRNRVVLAQAN